MRTRLIIGVVSIFTIFLISQLSPTGVPVNPQTKANDSLRQLETFDFIELADRLWEENNKQGAITALNIAIENQIGEPNTNIHKLLKNKGELILDQTLFGRIKSLGTSYALESDKNLSGALKGQLWQEFAILGESIILEPNSIGENISLLEPLAKIYPKASENYSVFKTLFQSGALSGAMAKNVNNSLSTLNSLNGNASNLTKITQAKSIIDQLAPIQALIDNCSSWYQVKLFLANSNSIKQVREITKIISIANNGDKLERLLTTLGNRSKNIRETTSYIQTYGQNGLENIFAAISKGPKGIQFVLENPTLIVNLSDQTPASANAFSPVKAKLTALKNSYGNFYEIGKNLIISLLLFICIISWIPKKLFVDAENETVKNYVAKNYLFIVVVVCSIIFLILVSNEFLGSTAETVKSPTLQSMTTAVSGQASTAPAPQAATIKPNKSTAVLSPISWAVMLIFLILHAIVGSNTKSKIFNLQEESKSAKIKLQLLKNIEHDLDLSVYIGLAGTVTSFIIMQFDPSGSRILAYSSTLAGIIISCVLKTLYYQPFLNALVAETEKPVLIAKREGNNNE